MALVTIHRSPTPSNYTTETLSCDQVDGSCEVGSGAPSPHRSLSSELSDGEGIAALPGAVALGNRRSSECYLAVKGAALILSQSECLRTVNHDQKKGDIICHLQSMFYLLRPQDTIKVAVKLESRSSSLGHSRYLALVSTTGTQDLEESVILGIDVLDQETMIGLVLPIWSDLSIRLDGDGGYSLTSNDHQHIFKPVSVQAMWSSLQCLSKVRDVASRNSYLPEGLTHTWIQFYQSRISSSQNFITEWHAMDDIESHLKDPESSSTGNLELEKIIRTKLREMALTVDFEEVTSKQLRTTLEEDMNQSLNEFRSFIDEEIGVIFHQMEAPSKIFDYLYLGTEWNASNLEELRTNGVGYILNVAREIDNFFPGSFKYLNIRVHDTDDADLLKHWDKTYKFISEAKNNQSKVLVHCKMGVSRSASTVVAFAMKEMNWNQEEALKFVQKQRSCVKPNKGFMKQLETYQGILDASKHRHNKLWRSYGAQTSTPIREADVNPLSITSDQIVGPSSESVDKLNSEDTLNTDCPAFGSDDSTGDAAHPPDLWSSFQSGSQDDLSSLCHDAFSDLPVDGIKLLRFERVDRDLNFSEIARPDVDVDESDSDETSSNDDNVHANGFYDLSMLAGFRKNSQCEDDDDDDAFLSVEESPFLHPDMVLEAVQAEHRKKRQTLQLLRQKQLSGNDSACDKSIFDSAAKRMSHSSCASENSEGLSAGPSLIAKVRPDNYWIREATDDGMPPTGTDSVDQELATLALVHSAAEVTNVLPVDETKFCVNQTTGSSVAKDTAVELIFEVRPLQESKDKVELEDSLSEPGIISKSVALSNRKTEEVSEILLESQIDSAECLVFGDGRMREFSGSADTPLQRPRSIYETEDILLEPGIVLKTKREFELREKSSSSIELSFGKEGKSVQRSSSWRLDRSRSRDRNSERRRTCLPVFLPCPASTDRLVKSVALGEDKSSEHDLCGGTDGTNDTAVDNLTVCRLGYEDVEVERGIVKKTTKGFEEGLFVPVVSATVELCSDDASSQAPVSVNNEFPVEVGLVKRQTRDIETRFGSTSPQLTGTRLLADSEARQPEESGGSERDANSFIQRENTTPFSDISLVPPSSDFLPQSSKAAVKRDERRMHLSLSQDQSLFSAQSHGSPSRHRKELFAAPLDLTQKELSTRKACSPMRENPRGYELHCAEAKKVPCLSENVLPQQDVSASSGSLPRDLSQGSTRPKIERLHDVADENFGGFNRTFSLRETSSMKFDETEKSKFYRSPSLRGMRPHKATTSPAVISAQLAGKQQFLASVAGGCPISTPSQTSSSSSSSMVLSMAKTFAVDTLAQSSAGGKQKSTDGKGDASMPDSSGSDRDLEARTVSAGITTQDVQRAEFQSALRSTSVSPLLPNKGLQKGSESLPLRTVSDVNCGALKSSNVAELPRDLSADVSDMAAPSDNGHRLAFSKNSCTGDKLCAVKSAEPKHYSSPAVLADAVQCQCSNSDVLSTMNVVVHDSSSAAFSYKEHLDFIKAAPAEDQKSDSFCKRALDGRENDECSKKENRNAGAGLMKSYCKMQMSDRVEKSKAKVIQIHSSVKTEKESRIDSGKPCEIAGSNAEMLHLEENKVSSASGHSLQKVSVGDSVLLNSALSDFGSSRKIGESKVSQPTLIQPENISVSNAEVNLSNISSAFSSKKSGVVDNHLTASNSTTLPSAGSALGSRSSFTISSTVTCDKPYSVLRSGRPNEDGKQLDDSNADCSEADSERHASKYDNKRIEASKLSAVNSAGPQIKDAIVRVSSKCPSNVSSNVELKKTVTIVSSASDKQGPIVDDVKLVGKSAAVTREQYKPAQSIARDTLECNEKKDERLPKSQGINLAPRCATADQSRLPSLDSVHSQPDSVKCSGGSNKDKSVKCQKELGKTSPHSLSHETKCDDEVAAVKVSEVVMRKKKPLKSQFSSFGSETTPAPAPAPARSASLHEQSSRKPYGKSHPLTKLPAEKTIWSLPLASTPMSQKGRVDQGLSSPVIDVTSGSDRLLN